MGIIKIKENLGEGRYHISIEKDVERAKSRKKSLEDQITELQKKIPDFQNELGEATQKVADKQIEVDAERQKLIDADELIQSLESQLNGVEDQISNIESQIQNKQNAKTNLENLINSGNFIGQDLADLQIQLAITTQDLNNLNADLTDETHARDEILKQISELKNPAKRIQELEKISSELMSLVFEKQRVQAKIDQNNIAIHKKQLQIQKYTDKITDIDERDAWCVDYALDLDEGLENLDEQIENISTQIARKNYIQRQNKAKLEQLQSNGFTNDSQEITDAKTAIQNNQEQIEGLKNQKDDLLRRSRRQSVEIIDENNHILIAPHTYVVKQEDINDKVAFIEKQHTKKDKFDNEALDQQVKLDENQQNLTVKNELLVEKSLDLASLIVTNPDEFPIMKKNLEDEINQIKQNIEKLLKEKTRILKKQKRAQSKADQLTRFIVRLQLERDDLQTAFDSQDKILIPSVSDRTLQFQPVLSSSPEATFFNKALFPGFQKFYPTYRTGTITEMTGETCTVTLDPATSNQQQLNVNQAEILTNVPFKYGSCDSAAFEASDNIIVQFINNEWSHPIVIGFQTNPKPCGIVYVTYADQQSGVGIYSDPNNSPFQSKLKRFLFLDNLQSPKIKNNYFAGQRYWYNYKKNKAISWSKGRHLDDGLFGPGHSTLYINGKFWEESTSKEIYAACIKNNNIFYISADDSGEIFRTFYFVKAIYSQNNNNNLSVTFNSYNYSFSVAVNPDTGLHVLIDLCFSDDSNLFVRVIKENNETSFIKRNIDSTNDELMFTFNEPEYNSQSSFTGQGPFTPPPEKYLYTLPTRDEALNSTTKSESWGGNTLSQLTIQGGGFIIGKIVDNKYYYLYYKVNSYDYNLQVNYIGHFLAGFTDSQQTSTKWNLSYTEQNISANANYYIGMYIGCFDLYTNQNNEKYHTVKEFNINATGIGSGISRISLGGNGQSKSIDLSVIAFYPEKKLVIFSEENRNDHWEMTPINFFDNNAPQHNIVFTTEIEKNVYFHYDGNDYTLFTKPAVNISSSERASIFPTFASANYSIFNKLNYSENGKLIVSMDEVSQRFFAMNIENGAVITNEHFEQDNVANNYYGSKLSVTT